MLGNEPAQLEFSSPQDIGGTHVVCKTNIPKELHQAVHAAYQNYSDTITGILMDEGVKENVPDEDVHKLMSRSICSLRNTFAHLKSHDSSKGKSWRHDVITSSMTSARDRFVAALMKLKCKLVSNGVSLEDQAELFTQISDALGPIRTSIRHIPHKPARKAKSKETKGAAQ